ncbi:MAG: molybdopterin-dependent oxidoreductase [Coriobacteriales bacterium]|nr:molybdopterin-dependent oxidoreductase [Coriobacteriales bacterium]
MEETMEETMEANAEANTEEKKEKVDKKHYTLINHKKPFRYDEDGLHVTRSCGWSAPGCHLGCGLLMYTNDEGRLVKVEGDPENPFNEGRVCCRCLALPEVVYHPDRILYPMKRNKEDRGKDKWEKITWDEAYSLVAEKFNYYKDTFGPETIAYYAGTGRDIGQYLTRLCWGSGSPTFVFQMSGQACYSPRVAGCFANTGAFWLGDYSQQYPDRYNNPNWQVPECIVIWGNNPIISNSDGLYGHWVVDCMKLGSELVVIDPRLTWLAAKAQHFLQIRPGTDAALALGMIDVIVKEDLYDQEFVSCWCYGFEELASRAAEYPLSKVSEITWIPANEIAEAARFIAKSSNAILQWGVAIDQTKETVPTAQALLAIFEITGNIDKPGAMVPPTNILNYAAGWGAEFLSREQDAKRLGQDKYPLLKMGFQECATDEVMNCLESGKPFKLKAAWIQTTNFLACTGVDPKRTLKAHMNYEFIVCVDLFMTPTIMALGDVFLPACTFAERDGLRIGDGMQRAETINKVIEPLGESKSDMEINLEIGKRISPEAWPWKDVEEMYSSIIDETGYSFKEMQEVAPGYPAFEYQMHKKSMLRQDGGVGFETPTGRIELWSHFYNMASLDPLPAFEEPTPGPVATPELLDEYPLVLTTGARNWSMFHSEHRQVPHLRAIHPDAIIEINPATAKKYGLKDGDWCWVENHLGRCKRRVVQTPIVNEQTCSTDHGWWLPEKEGALDEGLYGLWDMCVGNLIEYNCGKSGFGANYKTLLCKIYKVEEGE